MGRVTEVSGGGQRTALTVLPGCLQTGIILSNRHGLSAHSKAPEGWRTPRRFALPGRVARARSARSGKRLKHDRRDACPTKARTEVWAGPARALPWRGTAGCERAGQPGAQRIDFCGSTGLAARGMYDLMVLAFHSFVVWGVSPTTFGPALFTRCNPRLLRRADTAFAFIASHTV